MSVYEYAKVLGARAEQLECGASPRVPLGAMTMAYQIAEAEFRAGMINMYVLRRGVDGIWEERDLRDLSFVE
jgi:DNA-directed RNA polymerase I, II, and III subunit RPABC2